MLTSLHVFAENLRPGEKRDRGVALAAGYRPTTTRREGAGETRDGAGHHYRDEWIGKSLGTEGV
jgi:hypothetical protein